MVITRSDPALNDGVPEYGEKSFAYFGHTRREIEPLLPSRADRILEVGCGSGLTLRWLKERYPEATTVGIEYEASNTAKLKENTDAFYIADAETFSQNIGSFDIILFLDVLEHLRNPETVLRKFVEHLAPGGTVVVSVPNVSYIGVTLPLIVARKFSYADAGILDRTHTRLFVESTAIELLNSAGLIVREGLLLGMSGPKSKTLNAITFGLFRHHLTKQYVLKGTRAHPVEERQKPVRWMIENSSA
jgi:2-polyprenyl-3-methyl-5-hydroxy-6-metoxy-1,4-benzoquinol methylase